MVVVRPKDRREKKRAKQLANHTRHGYSSILNNDSTAAAAAAPSFDALKNSPLGGAGNEVEAQAVAKAIGMKEEAFDGDDDDGDERKVDEAPLSRTVIGENDIGTEESPSPTGPLVMDDEAFEDVPEMKDLGSPVMSDSEEEGERGAEEQEEEHDDEDAGLDVPGFKELSVEG